MKNHFFYLKLVYSVILLLMINCYSTKNDLASLNTTNNSPQVLLVVDTLTIKNDSIRKFDFANFQYPYHKDLQVPKQPKQFTLVDGESLNADKTLPASLNEVIYGDFSMDSDEDAILIMNFQTGGSGQCNAVYFYVWQKNKPVLKLLLVTGDWADKGLRSAYFEKNQVIIETYNPFDKKGDCYPAFFDRQYYEWKKDRLILSHQVKSLSNPDNNASYLSHK